MYGPPTYARGPDGDFKFARSTYGAPWRPLQWDSPSPAGLCETDRLLFSRLQIPLVVLLLVVGRRLLSPLPKRSTSVGHKLSSLVMLNYRSYAKILVSCYPRDRVLQAMVNIASVCRYDCLGNEEKLMLPTNLLSFSNLSKKSKPISLYYLQHQVLKKGSEKK